MNKDTVFSSQLSQLIGEQRKLICERAGLENMLRNLKELRNKLKVEQLQLTSMLRAELGDDAGPLETTSEICPTFPSSSGVNSPSRGSQAHLGEDTDVIQKPSLNLGVDTLDKMFEGRFYAKDQMIEEEDDISSEESDEIFEGAFEMDEFCGQDM